MRYYISTIFSKQLRFYRKRFLSIEQSVKNELCGFNPHGSIFLGDDLYKIRFCIPELPKGKSGSFRLIVAYDQVEQLVSPVAIYFKGDYAKIPLPLLRALWQDIIKEIKPK